MTTTPARQRATRYAVGYTVGLAETAADMREAQRLRHQVFAEEMGARLDTPITGLDVDPLDAYGDHLLVRHGEGGEVVGTHRLLSPRRADRLYADSTFDLRPLAGVRPDMVEAARACVRPDHRCGAVIGLMWAAIARYVVAGGHRWVAGCCSVPVSGVTGVAEVMRRLPLCPPEYRVTPRLPWRGTRRRGTGTATVPAPLRGYARLGAWVCGPPAHNPDLGTADFFVLLSMANLNPRYRRHFLGAPA
ncbi:GNAT family N-acetyltransferase [Streptosporangium sp. NPDC049376]|uniref:GNAT family N-acetyltransferase n=1 Tax=Streptosporangium sp. NPDC049376 TaxID=3366192 RepID=UPI0037989CD4